MRKATAIRSFMAAVIMLGVLSGCYFPVRFDAEIEIDPLGFYTLYFEGYMAEVFLYKDLIAGKLSKAEEEDKAAKVVADFNRSSSVKNVEYLREGLFQVSYERSGDIMKDKTMTFFRRNENILSISYMKKDGEIKIMGTPLSEANARRLDEIGLDMTGELRVITHAKVSYHNANSVKKGKKRKKIYTWNIKTAKGKAPMLTIPVR